MWDALLDTGTFSIVAENRDINSASFHVCYFAVAKTKTSLPPAAIGLIIKHCMVVGVALHFTVVTSWATQSVVERPVSAASCTRCIAVYIIAIAVDHIVASAISVVIVDIVVEIALANWLALALILLCCYGDE